MRTPQGSTHENEEKRRGDGGGGEPCGAPKVSDQKILHQGAPHDTAPQPTPPEATTNPLPAAALASDTARAAKNLVSTDSPARSSRPISMALASTSVRPPAKVARKQGSFSSDTCPGGIGWKPWAVFPPTLAQVGWAGSPQSQTASKKHNASCSSTQWSGYVHTNICSKNV
jgi:hypothetical protein